MFGMLGTLAAISIGGLQNGASYALGGLCASLYVAVLTIVALAFQHLFV